MPFSVIKPFKTLNRKFAAGAPITAGDIDPCSALTLNDWITSGFVKEDAALAPASVSAAPAPLSDKSGAE
jgi:hypothetical protein